MTDPADIFPILQPPREAWLARAEREPAIEPDLPIIDTHLHLWDYKGYRYHLDQYAGDLRDCGHHVEASVFVECSTMYRDHRPEHLQCVGETEFVVKMTDRAARAGTGRSGVAAAIVAYADLTLGPATRETLEAHLQAAAGRLRGIRQRAKWDADPKVRGEHHAPRAGLFREPAFGAGIDMLTQLGLSFDASVFHPQIPDVAALARAHPDASIVLNHTGSPVGHGAYAGRECEVHAVWLAGMKELARCHNVSVKLGGLLLNLANFHFVHAPRPPTSTELARLWQPYIEPCIELFGAARCMVASNFPVDKAGFGYGTVWNMFKRITAGCSAEEKAWLYSGTARRVYRLQTDVLFPSPEESTCHPG
ncbi:putative amidohydrolase 2 [Cupriavidus necator]|uniref:Putative amidohydrolase 2 n=1 Tax=Cupriavidus necator TaxID=106590 RepID=A0A1K0IHQ5_CUPNE|nr:putative amidohydrolase 2 [Cupriavidus necator]